MPMLTGLPGMGKKDLEADWFKTPRQALKILDKGKAATVAGENGAINIWLDKKGRMRAHVCRFLQTFDDTLFDDAGCLTAWLKPRLKEIRQPNAEARAKRKALFDDVAHVFGRRA